MNRIHPKKVKFNAVDFFGLIQICLASRLIVILNIQSNFDFSYLNILAEHFTEVGFNLWSNMPPESLVEV